THRTVSSTRFGLKLTFMFKLIPSLPSMAKINDKNPGVHPFYMAVEPDGRAHGVLLLNSNAQMYTFTPLPGLTWWTTGGQLDYFLFVGDHPEEVVQLYTS